jgi:hypothetical protein
MSIDLNNLPDEVLSYSNDQFYTFIENCLGVDEMNLLKLQSIKNIRTLLNVPDIFHVFSINCKELADLKNSICFVDEDDNNNIVIKSGIKAGIENLITTLKEKNSKYIKRTKNFKSSTSPSSSTTNHSNPNAQSSNTSISDPIDASLTSSPATASNLMPINDYIDLISNSIEKYSTNTFKNIVLKNNDDYSICLTLLHSNIHGHIKCGCGTKVKVIFRPSANSFQLSSYFKHVKKSHCSMIRKKKQVFNEDLRKKTGSLDGLLQNNNCSDMNDGNDYDEENLDDYNDSSQITTNTSISNNFSSLSEKRPISLSSSSSSSTNVTKKKKATLRIK